MSIRAFTFSLALLPIALLAQSPAPTQATDIPNTTTRAVLLANRPPQFSDAEWLKLMEKSVNRSLYPLRLSPAMLDTLDARTLDPRYQYLMTTTIMPEADGDQ